MDARCQMQERGERGKGDEPWSPPPDAGWWPPGGEKN